MESFKQIQDFLEQKHNYLTKDDLTDINSRTVFRQILLDPKYSADYIYLIDQDKNVVDPKPVLTKLSKIVKHLHQILQIMPNFLHTQLIGDVNFKIITISFVNLDQANNANPAVIFRQYRPNFIQLNESNAINSYIKNYKNVYQDFLITYKTEDAWMWLLETNNIQHIASYSHGHPKQLLINESLDGTNSYHSILYDYPSLLHARDFYRENQNSALTTFKASTLTYTRILQKATQVKKSANLLNMYPTLKPLSKIINFNKYDPIELTIFRYMSYKLTAKELKRVINDYRQHKKAYVKLINDLSSIQNYYLNHLRKNRWLYLYSLYLVRHFNMAKNYQNDYNVIKNAYKTGGTIDSDTNTIAYLFTTISNLLIQKPKSIEIITTSFKHYKYQIQVLIHQKEIKHYCDEYNLKANQDLLAKSIKWNRVIKQINLNNQDQTKPKITILRTLADLTDEGLNQHNCVATYVPAVHKHKSLIGHFDLDNDHYTFEITGTKQKFKLNQIYKQYDISPSDKATKFIQNLANQASK